MIYETDQPAGFEKETTKTNFIILQVSHREYKKLETGKNNVQELVCELRCEFPSQRGVHPLHPIK